MEKEVEQLFKPELHTFDNKSTEEILAETISCFLENKKKTEALQISQALLQKFGSFSGVLDTPIAELCTVKGVDQRLAESIQMLCQVAKFYFEDSRSSLNRIFDTQSACEVLLSQFLGKKNEAVVLLLLDGRGYVVYNGVVSEGSINAVPVYIRRVVELCLTYNANAAIISHNHPSGNPSPSREDLMATKDIEIALESIDVVLEDHIIFAGKDYVSMKSSKWMDKIKRDVRKYRENLMNEVREQGNAIEK